MADWTLGTTAQEHLVEHNVFDHDGIATPTPGTVLGESGGKITQVYPPTGFVRINNTNSPYAVGAGDAVILADCSAGNVIINLPTVAAANGRSLIIKRIGGSNSVTINRASTNQIYTDGVGATSKTLGSEAAHWSGVASSADAGWFTVGEYGTVT